MKKAIIVGASSGIGRALAFELSSKGYILGLCSRRVELLKDLQKELNTPSFIKMMDVTKESAPEILLSLIEEMEDVDLIILNSGIGFQDSFKQWQQEPFNWTKERITIETDVLGFTSCAMASYHYFLKRGCGHLVGVSSIASLLSNPYCPAYSSSKAYISRYLECLSNHAYINKKEIAITNILPGYVDTPMAQGEHVFWLATPKKAASQIMQAIMKKKKRAYITKRWILIAFLLKILPNCLLKRIY